MRFAAIALILLTGACAAPDVSSFKQSTLALTTSLNENQAALVASGEEISQKLGSPADLNTHVSTLKKQGKKVQIVAGVLATYANSIARLASAGEDGEKAANDLVSNLETTITNLSGNERDLPDSLSNLTAALGRMQQVAKNKELFEIMLSVKSDVDALAAELATLQNAERIALGGFETYWRTQRPDLNNYHQAFEQLMGNIDRLNQASGFVLNNAVKACVQAGNCDYDALLTQHRQAMQANGNEIGKLETLINEIRAFEAAYQAWDKEIRDWRAASEARVRAIPGLANAWQNDHSAIIGYLEDCTRFSGTFRRKCGAFSAANLELLGKLVSSAGLPF